MLFRDKKIEERFSTNGFITVPFLTASEVTGLLELFQNESPNTFSDQFISLVSLPYTKNVIISETIRMAFACRAAELFRDASLNVGSFIAKSNQEPAELHLHQDWNNVDSDHFDAATIWCPLCDVNISNGTMFVIPRSHRLFSTIRSGTFETARIAADDELRSFIQPIELNAGEALIFNPALLHGSYANGTRAVRVVAASIVIPKGAELAYHFHNPSNGDIDIYRIDEETLLRELLALAQGAPPEGGTVLRSVPNNFDTISEFTLLEKLRGQG